MPQRRVKIGRLVLAALALCALIACGGGEIKDEADASWLSAEELAKETGEVGDPCTPGYSQSYGCPERYDTMDMSWGCNRARTAALTCNLSADGWCYESPSPCLPGRLCVVRGPLEVGQFDCAPNAGGVVMATIGICALACEPQTPACKLNYPRIVQATFNHALGSDACAQDRAAKREWCANYRGGIFLEDGAPLPVIEGDCPRMLGAAYEDTVIGSEGCNRCVVMQEVKQTCQGGIWAPNPGSHYLM